MNWYKKAKILEPTETLPETFEIWYEAIRLNDGRILYDHVANHWTLYADNFRNYIKKVTNIESIGFLFGDGTYQVKLKGEEAWDYLVPDWEKMWGRP